MFRGSVLPKYMQKLRAWALMEADSAIGKIDDVLLRRENDDFDRNEIICKFCQLLSLSRIDF